MNYIINLALLAKNTKSLFSHTIVLCNQRVGKQATFLYESDTSRACYFETISQSYILKKSRI